ncbi:cytochrome c biogenesis protein CcmG, thiol:disulfide interchange protein DsbE [Abyssogena phaseoliformis symbiont OG214]|uniref:DsbE family thiol:disulfide interchange protein n=1 Tax=Abyssogena phaseoliformis symbiont TaxID=596095 RepID=UPI00191515AB|nr:DsbE family thiol:disulfide interchange protein [Abyssogena phaseoliformis symbiont]MBW5288912.1 Cytochrome c-type biogenesis protein CcmG/DsbE, thiol:disulfide oxidoreductase [Candidatus Ruthia sp. Apha_13_S6]BBB22555.1 cytochrome c biogenesis protein CcmG, thiol:disulfide interchange protein DsbE [Abyssogena phaseoliformis symbiont OG214]
MKKFLPLVLFIVLAGFLYIGLGLDPKKLPSPLIGKTFPNLEVEDFNTAEIYAIQDKLQGKISLVNVWASWCVTCRAEHEMLMQIAKSNSLQILGINYKDTKKDGNIFLTRLGNPYDLIVFDQSGKLGLELGVYATPETFIIDQQGTIRFKRIGELTSRILERQILPLISQLKNSAR